MSTLLNPKYSDGKQQELQDYAITGTYTEVYARFRIVNLSN